MSLLGFPLMRYIDINDSEDVIRACVMTDPEVPVDLVLHTPGGLVLAATQIARAIRERKGKVTVFVPHYAMSGGTLIALAADEIVMSSHAVLGPVDPQLGQYPAASLIKAVSRKPVAEVDGPDPHPRRRGREGHPPGAGKHSRAAHPKPDVREGQGARRPALDRTWTHDFPSRWKWQGSWA